MRTLTRTFFAALLAFALALVPLTANAKPGDLDTAATGEVALSISEVNLDGPAISDVTVTVDNGSSSNMSKIAVSFAGPINWTVYPAVQSAKSLRGGDSTELTFQIRVPEQRDDVIDRVFTATATYKGGDGAGTATAQRTQVSGTPPTPPTGSVFASDHEWLSATNGYGPVERDLANGDAAEGDGGAITLNGVEYEKGLGVHAPSDVRYYTGGNCSTFTASVGVDDYQTTRGSIRFSVLADGEELVKTPVLGASSETVDLEVDITGASYVNLVVDDGGDGINYDHGDWANAKFTCAS